MIPASCGTDVESTTAFRCAHRAPTPHVKTRPHPWQMPRYQHTCLRFTMRFAGDIDAGIVTRSLFRPSPVSTIRFNRHVKAIKPYGAFVEIRGMSGLLHISQISFDRIEDLPSIMQLGMKLKCMIIDHDKVRLVRRFMFPCPTPRIRYCMPVSMLKPRSSTVSAAQTSLLSTR